MIIMMMNMNLIIRKLKSTLRNGCTTTEAFSQKDSDDFA
jgi:hypothetical protein